tara:strand:- start:27 stop:266 length:240 start_codon:yes stop_codon:yes gene_type:complete
MKCFKCNYLNSNLDLNNNLDLEIYSQVDDVIYKVEITKNYENDKYHVAVFDDYDCQFSGGFKTTKELYKFLKQIQYTGI